MRQDSNADPDPYLPSPQELALLALRPYPRKEWSLASLSAREGSKSITESFISTTNSPSYRESHPLLAVLYKSGGLIYPVLQAKETFR